MAEAERLEHAPEAVIEVEAEHEHGEDVEERDGPDLKAGDDVVVDVVLIPGAAGMDGAEGEVEEMKDDEGEKDGAGPLHGAGGVGGVEILFFDVADGTGAALEEPELERGPDVKDDGDEQSDARAPQESGERFEIGGIAIDVFGREKDLQVAEQVGDDEAEEDDAGDGHDGFFADGGLPEGEIGGAQMEGSGTHRGLRPFGKFWGDGEKKRLAVRERVMSGWVAVEDMPSPPQESQNI